MSHRPPQRRPRARALPTPDRRPLWLAAAFITLLLILISAGSARAQFPRIGISGAAESFQDSLDVVAGENFTLYVGMYGIDNETPLEQDITTVSWVLHQVCCGAVIEVLDVEYNPGFHHEGDPHLGVISSSETCVHQPFIPLATLTAQLLAPEDGDYLAACGPYQQAVDCNGEHPIVMGLPMILSITGVEGAPVERSSWDTIKATYR